MRFASSSMSRFVLRFGTSAVMCSAWAWWWIIPFMKATSAFVCGVCSISSSSSGDSVCDGRPGAPGWTMFGAVSPTVSGSSEPPHPASTTTTTTAMNASRLIPTTAGY